jgi:polyisoprenoid-binding protein YceI
MKSKVLLALAAASAASFAFAVAPAAAAPVTYVFDKTHTEVRFCWKHFQLSTQCAHFLDYDGELVFDEAAPEKSKLKVVFKTDSIHTRVPKFDDHMKSADLFDTAKFPEASFVSTKLEKTGENTGKVTGDLTIKGVTKPITLDVKLNFKGEHPFTKKPALGFSATGNLVRSEYNVAYAAPAVSDAITLTIETELAPK